MKRLFTLALALVLLTGCAPRPARNDALHILCTTYPVYLFTTAITENAPEVEVQLLVNQQTSCLHDYTLTMHDMKAVDRADIIIENGAGLEEFLKNALSQKDVPVIDCSLRVDLLPSSDHHHHEGEDEHDHEDDPHFWLDPTNAEKMLTTITEELCGLDHSHAALYYENLTAALEALETSGLTRAPSWDGSPGFIPFHDGFQYFAAFSGLDLLQSIEEEEGAEASAAELREVIALVRDHHIPAIFVETNGSRRSAGVISRETGCEVYELDMIMSGTETGIAPYIRAMEQNLSTIQEALG